MNKTQQILTVIREKCGLMELKEGAKVIQYSQEYSKSPTVYKVTNMRDIKGFDTIVELYEKIENGTGNICYKDKNTLKIIGSEVQLNHLLLFMGGSKIDSFIKLVGLQYDLSKSVEQNLNDNAELREFIYKLIVK